MSCNGFYKNIVYNKSSLYETLEIFIILIF